MGLGSKRGAPQGGIEIIGLTVNLMAASWDVDVGVIRCWSYNQLTTAHHKTSFIEYIICWIVWGANGVVVFWSANRPWDVTTENNCPQQHRTLWLPWLPGEEIAKLLLLRVSFLGGWDWWSSPKAIKKILMATTVSSSKSCHLRQLIFHSNEWLGHKRGWFPGLKKHDSQGSGEQWGRYFFYPEACNNVNMCFCMCNL